MLIALANPWPKLFILSSLLLKLFLRWCGEGPRALGESEGDLLRFITRFSGVSGPSSITIWPGSSSSEYSSGCS